MFKALLVKKKLKKKVTRTLMENNRLRLVNLTSMLSLLSTSIITLLMMIILVMENLIRLVTVMLPADGFGSSNLVATFKPIRTRYKMKTKQNREQLDHLRDEHGERCDGGGGNEKRSRVDGRFGPR